MSPGWCCGEALRGESMRGKRSNTETEHSEVGGTQRADQNFCFGSSIGLLTPVNLSMSVNCLSAYVFSCKIQR